MQAAISKAQGEAEGLARREEEIKKNLAALGDADLSEFFAKNFEGALLGAEFRRQSEYAADKRGELRNRFAPEGELFHWADESLARLEDLSLIHI